MENFDIELGEYHYYYKDGKQEITRNDNPWRDETGDNFILAMAMRIQELEDELMWAEEESFNLRHK